ncbi:hypothetical protein TRFO_31033 [Tritrichomonas foetus]|uniref:Uncharacterized protein n=1 Tax=Tritrichomonas foetus TaxID=1144522 RepID=A0A1J4JTD8_9EUKA|nr:hypothetical protein TRFO_31033 [Tritrichomonas foetus]|eukprot:OHT02010.1 hypothetical protein TRFO_31033 [Tritrichomonas foetus]
MINERLQQMKIDRLKYTNIPWISVKTTYIQKPSRFGRRERTKSVATIKKVQLDPPTRHFFHHSAMMFSEEEYTLLMKAEADNLELNNKRLDGRSPSRLQKLQEMNNKRLTSQIMGNSTSSSFKLSKIFSNKMSKKDDFKQNDSVISFTPFVTEIGEEDKKTTEEIEKDDPIDITSGPVTIQDIEEQVWLHSHEVNHSNEEVGRKVEYLNGQILDSGGGKTGNQPQIAYSYNRGQRKIRNAIKELSSVQKESEELRDRISGKYGITTKKGQMIKENIEKSYSALRYKKYLYKQKLDVPEFIEDADFSSLQNKRKTVKDAVKSVGWEKYYISSSRKKDNGS